MVAAGFHLMRRWAPCDVMEPKFPLHQEQQWEEKSAKSSETTADFSRKTHRVKPHVPVSDTALQLSMSKVLSIFTVSSRCVSKGQ